MATARLMPHLLSGALDVREVLARLYDPDVLPLNYRAKIAGREY